MFKKIFSVIISAVIIAASTAAFAITAFGRSGYMIYSDGYGYKYTITLTIPASGSNVYLGGVEKCFNPSSYPYSKVGIHPNGSTVNRMNIWVCTSNTGSGVQSDKYSIIPNGNITQINYNYPQAFPVGSAVYFHGEQFNVKELDATVVMYGY